MSIFQWKFLCIRNVLVKVLDVPFLLKNGMDVIIANGIIFLVVHREGAFINHVDNGHGREMGAGG